MPAHQNLIRSEEHSLKRSHLVRKIDRGRLIERAKAYDEEALSELYHLYANTIFRYIYYRVGERNVAEDLVSDVFVRVLQDLPSYRDTGAPFEAWLYRIAHARVIDYYRRQKVRQTAPLSEGVYAGELADPDYLAGRRDDARRLWQKLTQLTDEQQQVLSLRFIAGYSGEQVAKALGKTEGAVKALQHRALASLRRLLEREP